MLDIPEVTSKERARAMNAEYAFNGFSSWLSQQMAEEIADLMLNCQWALGAAVQVHCV